MRPSRALRRARVRQMGRALIAPRAAENRYASGLRALMRGLVDRYQAALGLRTDSYDRAALDALDVQMRAAIRATVPRLYSRMALEVRMANREAAIKNLGMMPGADLVIERKVLEAREANIQLVENAGRDYAQSVRDVFEDPESFGLSVAELKDRLLAKGDISAARAELIARDQVLKLNAQVNQARQEAAGVEEYVWSTVGDDRVRPTHRAHEGRRYRWDTPPERTGHPGHDVQCRCVPIPVLDEFDGI